ncbi:hypothetical protein IAT38_001622 [Cryptococcus sp. DSM 104549]
MPPSFFRKKQKARQPSGTSSPGAPSPTHSTPSSPAPPTPSKLPVPTSPHKTAPPGQTTQVPSPTKQRPVSVLTASASTSSTSIASLAPTPIFEKFSPRKVAPSTVSGLPNPSSNPVASAGPSSKENRPRTAREAPSSSSGSEKHSSSSKKEKSSSTTRVPSPSEAKDKEKHMKEKMATTASTSPKGRGEQQKERVGRQAKQASNKLTPLKIYLLAYNTVSALLWGHLLLLTVWFLVTPRGASTPLQPINFLNRIQSSLPLLFGRNAVPAPVARAVEHLKGSYDFHGLGWWTKWTQTLAVLEVVHAGLGWVRSPVGTVASQVASRVWTVWGVVEAAPGVTHDSPLFTTMLFAWSLTEVVRYTFYALSLLSISSPALNWLRYSTFIPLYPLGAGSEAFLSFSTLPAFAPLLTNAIGYLPEPWREVVVKSPVGRQLFWSLAKARGKGLEGRWGWVECVRAVMFVIWWPALYQLYTYMLKQRRKVLGKGKTVGGVNKTR